MQQVMVKTAHVYGGLLSQTGRSTGPLTDLARPAAAALSCEASFLLLRRPVRATRRSGPSTTMNSRVMNAELGMNKRLWPFLMTVYLDQQPRALHPLPDPQTVATSRLAGGTCHTLGPQMVRRCTSAGGMGPLPTSPQQALKHHSLQGMSCVSKRFAAACMH